MVGATVVSPKSSIRFIPAPHRICRKQVLANQTCSVAVDRREPEPGTLTGKSASASGPTANTGPLLKRTKQTTPLSFEANYAPDSNQSSQPLLGKSLLF